MLESTANLTFLLKLRWCKVLHLLRFALLRDSVLPWIDRKTRGPSDQYLLWEPGCLLGSGQCPAAWPLCCAAHPHTPSSLTFLFQINKLSMNQIRERLNHMQNVVLEYPPPPAQHFPVIIILKAPSNPIQLLLPVQHPAAWMLAAGKCLLHLPGCIVSLIQYPVLPVGLSKRLRWEARHNGWEPSGCMDINNASDVAGWSSQRW